MLDKRTNVFDVFVVHATEDKETLGSVDISLLRVIPGK